jgi:hypothetical protein
MRCDRRRKSSPKKYRLATNFSSAPFHSINVARDNDHRFTSAMRVVDGRAGMSLARIKPIILLAAAVPIETKLFFISAYFAVL